MAQSGHSVFVVADLDPVKSGLVASLNRPGGNITGVAPFTSPLAEKRVQLLHELLPNATVIGFLVNPANPGSESEMRDVRSAVLALGLQLVVANASSEFDLNAAFIAFAGQQIRALIVASDPMFLSRREELIALTARYAMAAIYPLREFATNGGLLSYAPSLADGYRLAGVYVGKILKGEKPADLPITQPTKFELVINMKAAEAIVLAVSNSMQLLADEVIE
jgi:putative ABC transport system substrate-binding protein